MKKPVSRKEALEYLEYLRRNWESAQWPAPGRHFSKSLCLRSSHKGEIQGAEKVMSAFTNDTQADNSLKLVTSNYYAAADGQDKAMVSAYLYGEIFTEANLHPSAAFGAVLRITLQTEDDVWKMSDILVNISWTEGHTDFFPDWQLPPGEKGWRPGDAPPALVSELDSPWHCIPDNKIDATDVEQIEETYSRYSWGIDQNDFGQFRTCYTSDAKGLFPPLGPLEGLHNIVGSLKEFRRHWPWMQHYGVPLKTIISSDGLTAELWIGRPIQGRFWDAQNQPLYGAHYRIELRKEQGIWKFTWSEYVPGWFTTANMPFNNT